MNYYDKDLKKKTPREARSWTGKPLTNQQKASLSMAARDAYAVHERAGLADNPFDEWRHEQTKIACGKASLRDATQENFRSILGHFQRLAGKESAAAKTWGKTGRVEGSDETHDTHENREVARHALRMLVRATNGVIDDEYCETVCQGKSDGKGTDEATAKQLQEVLFTVRARAREKGIHV